MGGAEYDGDDPMARMIAAGAQHYDAALPTQVAAAPLQSRLEAFWTARASSL